MSEGKTRYHLNTQYFNEPPDFDGIALLQLGRRYCSPTETIRAHPHLNWYELTVVTGGKGTISTNGEPCPVKSGDIHLSFPCDIHEIRADDEEKLEYDYFSFFCNDTALREDLKSVVQNHFGGTSRIVYDEKIAELVKNAITEFSVKNQPHSERALSSIFHLILIYLVRDFADGKRNTADVSDAEILCFRVMNYIDTHVYSLQSLEELAPKFNYNYGYLSGLFKRTTGKNLSEYYQHRKMETAKALILENKKKIGQIAEMLHYSPYSFSKAFKAKYGVSPKAMQQKEKESHGED